MSQENVEVVRRAIEAYGRAGPDGVLRDYDPEIEWTSTGDYIERATNRGYEGLRRYLARDIVEIEQKETVSRKEVATRLRKLATMLAKGNEIKFDQGGMAMSVHVPDEVQLKVEVEASTDERELEIERPRPPPTGLARARAGSSLPRCRGPESFTS